MRRFCITFADASDLDALAEQVRVECGEDAFAFGLFHIYVDTKDRRAAASAIDALNDAVPDAAYVGSSTVGNIVDGQLVQGGSGSHVTVLCDVFEDPATRVEVMQFGLDYECQDETAALLLDAVAKRPWVKAIEMHACVGGASVPDFCGALSAVHPDITFFGGAALCPESFDVTTHFSYVLSSEGEIDDRAVVFTFYGGENFHVTTQAIMGWKPLGRPFEVTRTERSLLYELDGEPAYEVYNRYLHIPSDENFFNNGLVFPLMFERNGMQLIKAPSVANEDGSLVMTSEVTDDLSECRIAYGDPATILESIRDSTVVLRKFAPQVISIYTCASRRLYWGQDYVDREYMPFQSVAPASGWFTGSEFARHQGEVLQHNVTLVVAGLREGPALDISLPDASEEDVAFNRQMALVRSLTAFVGTTSAELQEAYERMEVMAKTDGLTGLADRRETEAVIEEAIESYRGKPSSSYGQAGLELSAPCLIMFDLDDFKAVNDDYGHKEGDDVLRGLSGLVRGLVDEAGLGTSGRWGGEEFMVVLPSRTISEAQAIAEDIRTGFAEMRFPVSGSHTMSLGVCQVRQDESADSLCSRVDKALYAAKNQGKNRVVMG